ncbi:MAG: HEPN domain-containing protein [Anaerolineales bacterium]|nr:HEPN domain-containing protein [Anaerolineales bacterium]
MKDSTHQLMLNAEETLHAAEILFKEEYLRDAINRAYYSVFYIAEALLNEKDLRYSKHGTVHGAFAQHYIKTKIFDEKYHKLLTGSFRRRMLGDYDEVTRFSSSEVTQILEQAWDFLKTAKDYLASQP